MITTDRPVSSKRTVRWSLAVVALVSLGMAAWWLASPGASLAEREGAAGQGGSGGRMAGSEGDAPTGALAGQGSGMTALAMPTVLPDGRPSDFSPEDWSALKEAMAKTANPQAELQRVVGYLRFQKRFEEWQSLRESGSVARRQQLAATLVEQVPERLRQGEVTMGEALMLSSALWADLEPNADKRKVRLEEAQAILTSAAPQPDAEQQAREAAQQAEYKRREAAIVLEYQSRPEAQKDQAWLEGQLDTARRAVYGAN